MGVRTAVPGVLTVAAYVGFFPVCYLDGAGRVVGSDPAIVERFAATLGLRVEYVVVDEYRRTYELSGRDAADMGVGGVAMTPDRVAPHVVWSAPYAVTRRTLVYNVAAPVRRFPDDLGRTGAVLGTAGSTGFEDARRRLPLNQRELLVPESGGEAASLRALLDGAGVQGLLRGSVAGEALVRRFPGRLGMTEPWDSADAPEHFRFPCSRRSGVEPPLSAFLRAALADDKGGVPPP